MNGKPFINSLINWIKDLRCKLDIHYPIYRGYNFTDYVAGEAVNNYSCERCNKYWMAIGKYSRFKVEKEETQFDKSSEEMFKFLNINTDK
ncbi:MAG: hypothetical protein ACOC1K_03925 [Nanoarchaeota archaeon]